MNFDSEILTVSSIKQRFVEDRTDLMRTGAIVASDGDHSKKKFCGTNDPCISHNTTRTIK